MAISVKLSAFEGPLDLLLHLIDKNKVDIYDIPIVEITSQYMEYLEEIGEEDLEVMSEFLVMAATLLDIKCRMLLPKPKQEEEEEEDPRAELVQRLLEYKTYKYMSYELKTRMDEADGVFFRSPSIPREVLAYREPVDPSELLKDLTLEKMNAVYRSVMRRREDRVDPVRSRFGRIEKEPVSVADKMIFLRDYAMQHTSFSFRSLLEGQTSRTAIVVTFLSVLELIKMGHIRVEQGSLHEDIRIQVADDPAQWKNLTEYSEE